MPKRWPKKDPCRLMLASARPPGPGQLVFHLHLQQALHHGLAGRHRQEEGILRGLPLACEAHLAGDCFDGEPRRLRGRVDPGGCAQQDDFAHLELDLADAGRQPALGTEAPAASRDDGGRFEHAAGELRIGVVADRRRETPFAGVAIVEQRRHRHADISRCGNACGYSACSSTSRAISAGYCISCAPKDAATLRTRASMRIQHAQLVLPILWVRTADSRRS